MNKLMETGWFSFICHVELNLHLILWVEERGREQTIGLFKNIYNTCVTHVNDLTLNSFSTEWQRKLHQNAKDLHEKDLWTIYREQYSVNALFFMNFYSLLFVIVSKQDDAEAGFNNPQHTRMHTCIWWLNGTSRRSMNCAILFPLRTFRMLCHFLNWGWPTEWLGLAMVLFLFIFCNAGVHVFRYELTRS